jgi:hypothetical protein
MRLVLMKTWDDYIVSDQDFVPATGASCTRCGREVFARGSGDAAVQSCADRLHRECPRREANKYVLTYLTP